MPQMCPMNWLMLMFYFQFCYLIFVLFIYFMMMNFELKVLLNFNKSNFFMMWY